MTYAESEKIIRNIRSRHEIMFRMAVSHLMDVGIRNLTEEAVKATCEEIRNEDDSNSFMTNDFKCDLVQLAGELAKIDHVHLLVYISRHVEFDVGDYKPSYEESLEVCPACGAAIDPRDGEEDGYGFMKLYWNCDECGASGYAELDMQNGNDFVGHVC